MSNTHAFSDARFWNKLSRTALIAGREVVERALQLFYALNAPNTPRWAKTVIVGALAYFLMPTDAVPDFIPGIGYVDDLGAIITALTTVSMYVTDDMRDRARARVDALFGRRQTS